MDGASYGDIRQTVNELAAVTSLFCACFDSTGRCFIHSHGALPDPSAENIQEFPFFSEFSRSVLKNRTGRCAGFLFADESGRYYLTVPLFLDRHYWGGVFLMKTSPAATASSETEEDVFPAFAEDLLTVYAAALQENIQAYYERMDLLRHLGEWYPMENWIRERRSALCRLWGEKLSYQMNFEFLRDSINTVHSLAVLEDNREIEEKYERLVQLLRIYRQRDGQKIRMHEETDFIALYRDCLSSFCGQKVVLSLQFDEKAGECVIPALSLSRIAGSALEHSVCGDATVNLSVQTQRAGDQAVVSIRGSREPADTDSDGWLAYSILLNHGGTSVGNMPIPVCLKAVRDLKGQFREKLCTSFTLSDTGEFCIQLAFPCQTD